MGKIIAEISMSLDGYIAGPDPTLKEPLGKRGEELHEWVVRLATWRKAHGMSGGENGVDGEVMEESTVNLGAVIMGRKMFSGGEGPWAKDPNAAAWWGDNPPFHVPVFVLTHHKREKVNKKGGTTFTFVTDGIESALSHAKKAAGSKNIQIAGGASVIQQCIKIGSLDELQIHMVPILLGGGTPLLENLGNINLEKMKDKPFFLKKIRVIDSPLVTHLKFRLKK